MRSDDPVVNSWIQPLARYVETRGAHEVVAVRPGEVRIEFPDCWREYTDRALSLEFWEGLATALARSQGRDWDQESRPVVSAQLPGGHRLELLVSRRHTDEGLSASVRVNRGVRVGYGDFAAPAWFQERLTWHVRNQSNIMVGGATGSGKTSLLGALLGDVPSHERVLTVEDLRELGLPHIPNRVHYVVERHEGTGITYAAILDHLMRSRPDRILLGELSITNVAAALMVMSTGHRGLMMSVHSSSVYETVNEAFYIRYMMAGQKADRGDVAAYVKRNIDLVLQVKRGDQGRVISEMWDIAGGENPRELA